MLLAGVGWEDTDKHRNSFEHAFCEKLAKMQDAMSHLVLTRLNHQSIACNECRLACLFASEENGMDLDWCEHTTIAQFDMKREHEIKGRETTNCYRWR